MPFQVPQVSIAVMEMPNLSLEENLGRRTQIIAGVDEVGRGALAGPVVASAVVLPAAFDLTGIKDSKLLSNKRREQLASSISLAAIVGFGMATVKEIDQLNILQATLLAMTRALRNLPVRPDKVIVDGIFAPAAYKNLAVTIPKADQTSLTVAAASICAKCWRDKVMQGLAKIYPNYHWATNVGYGTADHQLNIRRHGITCWHRTTFSPCAQQHSGVKLI